MKQLQKKGKEKRRKESYEYTHIQIYVGLIDPKMLIINVACVK